MKATPRLRLGVFSFLLVLTLLLTAFFVTPAMAQAEYDLGQGITPDELDALALDPQSWRIQDTMTWDDWKDNPAIDYRNDDNNIPIKRDLKGLLVLVDYYDRGFMVLDEVGSDPMGNPRVRVDTENGETVADFWERFLTVPGEWNQYTSLQDHWYDNAYGTWKIDIDVVGPYTLPYFEFQYGFYNEAANTASTWPSVFPNMNYYRSTHPYYAALEDGYRFWDVSVQGGEIAYDFMFVHHAGYAQSNTWQEMGEMMFADKMSVWNAPAGSLKDPYTGEPLGDDISGYDFTGLARLDKIKGILTEPGFDIVRDWPNFYMSDMDVLWKQHVSGFEAYNVLYGGMLLLPGDLFRSRIQTREDIPVLDEFLAAIEASQAENATAAYNAYQAANPGSAHTLTTYQQYFYRYDFLEQCAKERKLKYPNRADVEANWTDEYKAFLADNTSEIILQRVIAKVDEARELSLNSTTNPNNGWARSRYGDDPWSSWYGGLPIWSHTSSATDKFAGRRTDYSCQGESNGLGTYSHEFGHIIDFPDNYNDPFAANPTRVPVGQWDLMGGGSFGGPGGAHTRWMLPVTLGASLPPNQVLRGKILNQITDPDKDVYHITYAELANELAIAEVYARNIPTNLGVEDGNGNEIVGNRGFRITGMTNQIPRESAVNNLLSGTDKYGFRRINPVKWNWGANSTFNTYTMEVVQRTAYDSFMSDSGVLMALNHDDVMSRSTNSTFIVDANPGGLSFADYRHPTTGAFVPLPDGGEQQIATALFHAGLHNDPTYYREIGEATGKWDDDDNRTGVAGETTNEYIDTYNNLHFYILSKNYTHGKHGEILSYDVAARRTDVDYQTGGELILEAVGAPVPASEGNFAVQRYSLTNTGETDIVRITLDGELNNAADNIATKDQNVAVLNNLYAIGAGETIEFDVFIKAAGDMVFDTSNILTVAASSETTADKAAEVAGPVIYMRQMNITFDANGGTAVDAQTVDAGSLVTKPADPQKDGYTFLGWYYVSPDYTTLFNFDEMRANWDITLTAQWEAIAIPPTTHTVTFYWTNGTTVMGTLYIEDGGYLDADAVPAIDPSGTKKVVSWLRAESGNPFNLGTQIHQDYSLMPWQIEDYIAEPLPDLTHTVEFIWTDGHTVLASLQIEDGDSIDPADVPLFNKAGDRQILSWLLAESGNPFNLGTRIHQDYRLMPWEVEDYTQTPPEQEYAIKITGVSNGKGQANVLFDIRSANGKGYTVYLSETGEEGSFAVHTTANYNANGANIKGLTGGKTYYVYIQYSSGETTERSEVVELNPR